MRAQTTYLPSLLLAVLAWTTLPLDAAIIVTGQSNRDASDWADGSVNANNLVLGGGAPGTLTVNDGSTLVTTGRRTFFGSGSAAGGNAVVTITDAGSQLTINSTDSFNLGNNFGIGTMSVENGASFVTNQEANLGVGGANGQGHLTVDGSGSLWDADSIAVGRVGTGSLSVLNQGQVTTTSLAIGRDGGSGSLTVTGNGSSSFSTVTINGGGLNVRQGSSLHVSNGGRIESASDVNLSGANMIVEGSGSRITTDDELFIASVDGQAHLIVQDGAQVRVGSSGGRRNTTVGSFVDSSGGSLTVTGSGSTYNSSENFSVGDRADGTVNILDGGRINNSVVFRIFEQGEVNVRGSSSVLNSDSQIELREGGGVLNVLNGGRITTRRYLEVRTGSTVNLFVDGNNVVRTGTSGFSGGYDNRGTTNLFADAGLAAGDYTPISNGGGGVISNFGTINALGGTFDTGTGVFSVSEITTNPTGALGGLRVQYEGDMVVSFADGVGDITFDVMSLNTNFIEGEFILVGYNILAPTLDGTPTGLTFILQEAYEFEDLTFWYQADSASEWTEVDPNQTQVDGVNASLLVSQFSSYAVTHATVIPEPTTGVLLGTALLAAAYRRRQRR